MVAMMLWVGFGGFFGAVLRFYAQEYCNQWMPPFPTGTLFVNALGCFIAGILMVYLQDHPKTSILRLVSMVGFLGGFTTFSAFSVETLHFTQTGQWRMATLNVFGNVTLSLAAVFSGAKLAGCL